MPTNISWIRRVANVFRRNSLHRDIERELTFHIAERMDDLTASGLSEAEAARIARQQFGNLNLQIEETSHMDFTLWLDAVLRHFRLAVRTLAKSPGFTATIVFTLTLGIGANSAVFSALDAVILRPLPFPDGDRLVTLQQRWTTGMVSPIAPVRLEEWNRLSTTLEAISGSYVDDASETSGELPERIHVGHVAPRFLQVLEISPALGRGFTSQEELFGGPNAVLISDGYWRRRFAADPSALGKRLRLGSASFTVIGVMPASFRFTDSEVDVWYPVPLGAPYAQNRNNTFFVGVGHLKPGVTLEQARANLVAIQTDLGHKFPDSDAKITPSIESLKESAVGGVRRSMWLLYGSVTLLLLIACANIAALLLARAAHRQPEISVRFSLGATRASVIGQLLTESFLLAATGSAAGFAIAVWSTRAFQLLARDLPRIDEITVNFTTLLYTLIVALATTLLCGLIPALRGTRGNLRESIALGGRTQVSSRGPLQWALVGVQIALSVTLLAGAGLMIRSFQELARISPGFDAKNILGFHMSVSWAETTNPNAVVERSKRLIERLRATPGIDDAAIAPLPGVNPFAPSELKLVEGRAASEAKLIAANRRVSPGYFSLMKIPIVSGQLCRETSATVTGMVNRTFADKYFSNEADVIGKHIANTYKPIEIQGIVADSREDGLMHAPAPTFYTCLSAGYPGSDYLVKTAVPPQTIRETLRRVIAEIEPGKSVYDLVRLEDHLSDSSAQQRLLTVLLTGFAFTAIALASVGLYGTLSYFVNLRRKEVGLHLALGAARSQIVAKFLRQGLMVSGLGCLAGLALTAATTHLLAGMLFGVASSDMFALSSVTILVLGVTTFAALIPSIRAARVEPMQVLRDE